MKNQELSPLFFNSAHTVFVEIYGNCCEKIQACQSSPSAKIKLFN